MYITVSLKVTLCATSSLEEMETQIQTAGREAMKEALKEAIKQREEHHHCCPNCGSGHIRSRGSKRRVVLTQFGRVELHLLRKQCQRCLRSFRPAEEVMASLKGHCVTKPLRALAALVGSSWPYETAAHVLQELSGTQISDERLRQITNEEGSKLAHQQEHVAKACLEPSMEAVRRERDEEARRKDHRQETRPVEWLQVGLDGGWIPSRDQPGGMEGKVAVVASTVEAVGKQGRHRLGQRRYAATFAGAQTVGELAFACAKELGATEAGKQVVLGDGAQWIKTQAAEHFPDAVRVLDWPHLWRVIHAAIRALHPGRSTQRRAWRKAQYETLRPLLWTGQVDQALAHLHQLRPKDAPEPIKRVEDAISYLETQREWIGNYEQWREEGYPVGSGLVERAVAVTINMRMKKRGMRWLRANATAVVALRVQQINTRWQASSSLA